MLLSIIKAFLEDMTVLHVRALLHEWQSITALCLGSLLSLVSSACLSLLSDLLKVESIHLAILRAKANVQTCHSERPLVR